MKASSLPTFVVVGALALMGVAALMGEPQKPDHAGYIACANSHPERFCRLQNGFPMEAL